MSYSSSAPSRSDRPLVRPATRRRQRRLGELATCLGRGADPRSTAGRFPSRAQAFGPHRDGRPAFDGKDDEEREHRASLPSRRASSLAVIRTAATAGNVDHRRTSRDRRASARNRASDAATSTDPSTDLALEVSPNGHRSPGPGTKSQSLEIRSWSELYGPRPVDQRIVPLKPAGKNRPGWVAVLPYTTLSTCCGVRTATSPLPSVGTTLALVASPMP